MNDAILLLETLYGENEFIWSGDKFADGIIGTTVRTREGWIDHWKKGGETFPHFIINPLTGMEGHTKDGEPSFRCDNTVKTFRYCLVEFDNLSRADQIRFWSAVKLPIVALIDSAGKSIHALLQVSKLAQVETVDQWTAQIKERLYDRILTPMGVDSQCSNPSRLSRLPGHYRKEKQAWQRLLWLSPEGRSLC